MKISSKRLAAIIAGLLVALSITACGGGGGGEQSDETIGSASRASGTVGVLLTDKPADPSMFAAINVTIEAIELIDPQDDEKISLYSGPAKTSDLLRLRHEAVPIAFRDGIPSGVYCKIRLTLSDIQLVLADGTPRDPTDNPTYHPRLPGNGKLDLVARNCFRVAPGEVVALQLDIDAGQSIHIVGNNNGFNFRPVVFVDALHEEFAAKLVRLHGIVKRIDEFRGMLLLCRAIPVRHPYSRGCVEIHLGEDAAFFDNQTSMGAPRPISELLAEDKIGKRVTVVGRPRHWVRPYIDFDVPEGHYPPPGSCRLWNIGLPPGLQAQPIDCDALADDLPAGFAIVTHDGTIKFPHHPLMVLDGLAVELGKFLRIDGDVAIDADGDGFGMTVTSGDAAITDTLLEIILQQDGTDFNGTRIVSKSGALLDFSSLVAPLPVQVDGVLEPGGGIEQMLKAALVIVDVDAKTVSQLTGTVLSAGANSLMLDPDEDTVCGLTTDMLSVEFDTGLQILTVTITDSSSQINPGGALAAGQTIGAAGGCRPGGFLADSIIIVDDQRTPP